VCVSVWEGRYLCMGVWVRLCVRVFAYVRV
jgi:hypothetical protein